MINKLQFFGCSFTALETSNTGHQFVNYRKLITNGVHLPHISHAVSGKSNQHIINDVYLASKQDGCRDSIFVIQYTFFNRLGMYSDLFDDAFISMCTRDISNDMIESEKTTTKFYQDWLSNFYSRRNALLEMEKQINMLSAWLHSQEITFISFGYDNDMDLFSKSFYDKNQFVKFQHTYSMYADAVEHKRRISDIGPIEQFNDHHLNKDGHEYLAQCLVEKIRRLK
jgi:hypothetical protein